LEGVPNRRTLSCDVYDDGRTRRGRTPPPQQPRQQRSKHKQQPLPIQGTAIEDLESEEDDDYIPQRPPIGIRTNAGNYEISDEFGETEPPNRKVKKGVKTSTQMGKGGKVDILAAAQAMQKDRDADMENQRPVGKPPDRM